MADCPVQAYIVGGCGTPQFNGIYTKVPAVGGEKNKYVKQGQQYSLVVETFLYNDNGTITEWTACSLYGPGKTGYYSNSPTPFDCPTAIYTWYNDNTDLPGPTSITPYNPPGVSTQEIPPSYKDEFDSGEDIDDILDRYY
ncbi:MAG: hypothetical protein EBU90_03575 [Proteobacteria bacterium]|nr:hypothetical protein [Pseudomonadota bacterium]NBP13405.1 hypothetical protein [bacterium]